MVPICQEPINSLLMYIYTTMWVQQTQFLFHPISPSSHQAANLGRAVCSDWFWNISKSGTCMLSPPTPISYQSLCSHPLHQEGLLKSQFSNSTPAELRSLPEASEHSGLIICYVWETQVAPFKVAMISECSYILVTFFERNCSPRVGSVGRNIQDILGL